MQIVCTLHVARFPQFGRLFHEAHSLMGHCYICHVFLPIQNTQTVRLQILKERRTEAEKT